MNLKKRKANLEKAIFIVGLVTMLISLIVDNLAPIIFYGIIVFYEVDEKLLKNESDEVDEE